MGSTHLGFNGLCQVNPNLLVALGVLSLPVQRCGLGADSGWPEEPCIKLGERIHQWERAP